MKHLLLDRSPHRPDTGQPFLGDLRLARGRVHEAHGGARHTLALMLAGAMAGPLFWVAPAWTPERLYPPGLANIGVNPGRITFVHARHATDILWTLEEILRSGAVGLVVGDLPGPPGLTPMRRMQLAAEAGAAAGRTPPLGLILTPEGGAAGAESRWKMTPDHAPEQRGWQLTRERARSDPPATWRVVPKADGFALLPSQDLTGNNLLANIPPSSG